MAEEKKGKGLFRQIGEVVIVDVAKKVGGFLIIVGIILKIADVVIPKIGFDLPFGMGRMSLPQTNFFDQYVGTLSEITMSLLVGAFAAFFWPAVIVLLLVLAWRFLNWAPVKDEPVIRQRMMNALFHGVHAGGKKGAELTGKGIRAGAASAKAKLQERKATKAEAERLVEEARKAAGLAAIDQVLRDGAGFAAGIVAAQIAFWSVRFGGDQVKARKAVAQALEALKTSGNTDFRPTVLRQTVEDLINMPPPPPAAPARRKFEAPDEIKIFGRTFKKKPKPVRSQQAAPPPPPPPAPI